MLPSVFRCVFHTLETGRDQTSLLTSCDDDTKDRCMDATCEVIPSSKYG